MRLLSVIHGPVFGGAHNQALQLAEPLASRGVETTVALPLDAEVARARLQGAAVETVTLPLHRLRASPRPDVQARFLAGLIPEVRQLRGLIRERGVDLVQAHGPTNPHAAIAAHREGIPLVWQILDTRAPMALRRATMPLVTRLADAVTVWGRTLARVHPGAEGLGDRLVVVFPPVNTDRLAPDPELRAEARRRLRIPEDTVAVGTLGVLNPQKGHHQFARAAALVARRHPEACFRVLGAPSPAHARYEQGLRAEARSLGLIDGGRFEFMDPGERAADLLHALDVFVLASVPRSEGMPTAVLEAMSCGVPVVVTDVGAIGELVDDGRTGLIVGAQTPEAIAAAVERLLDEPELRMAIGAAARGRVLERFDLETLADLHLSAYERARAHRAARAT